MADKGMADKGMADLVCGRQALRAHTRLRKDYILKGYLSFLGVQGIVLLHSHVFRVHMGHTDG
jgi:hypothetical protein